jgi:PilZ domain
MEERRAKPRHRVFKAGTIEFDGSGVDCTIRNMSPTGAALDVASPVGIPHEITLNIASQHERQNCHIVWRKEKRIGVSFAE